MKDGKFYKVVRITGPTHNFLAIRLSQTECPTVVRALPAKQGDVERLNRQEVLSQVLDGLDSVNIELGENYFLSEVQFIPSDSASPSVYNFLTKELIKRIHSNGDFVVV